MTPTPATDAAKALADKIAASEASCFMLDERQKETVIAALRQTAPLSLSTQTAPAQSAELWNAAESLRSLGGWQKAAADLLYDEIVRLRADPAQEGVTPRLTDNDAGEITVALGDKELRGWSYANDDERRIKMLAAREYVEGYCDGRDK